MVNAVLRLSSPSVYVNQYESETILGNKTDCNDGSACCTIGDTHKQFDLYENETQYIVYKVAEDDLVRQFELSIQAAVTSPSSHRQETLRIQPWRGTEVFAGNGKVSNTTTSSSSANLNGTVTMGNIGVESYDIFQKMGDPPNNYAEEGLHVFLLAQNSTDDEGECLRMEVNHSIKQHVCVPEPAVLSKQHCHTFTWFDAIMTHSKNIDYCSGTLIDDYFVDVDHLYYEYPEIPPGVLNMSRSKWAEYRGADDHCAEPLGSPTSLGVVPLKVIFALRYSGAPELNPYWGIYDNATTGHPEEENDRHYHPYLFSDPIPDPSPYDRGHDPYNQLAWYENNVWAFSFLSGPNSNSPPPRFPLGPQQYGRNTIAANIRSDLTYNCSMLFNVPSDGDMLAGTARKVNLEQAVICEYPNNFMGVSISVSMEAFGFAKDPQQLLQRLQRFETERLMIGSSTQVLRPKSFSESERRWYPGAKYGLVNLTLINTSNKSQFARPRVTGCCMTSPSLECSGVYASVVGTQVWVPKNGSAFAQFSVQTQQYGEGYCNVSVVAAAYYLNGTAISQNATRVTASGVWGQIKFATSSGPPVSFHMSFNLYFLGMERSKYVIPATTETENTTVPGIVREYEDESYAILGR